MWHGPRLSEPVDDHVEQRWLVHTCVVLVPSRWSRDMDTLEFAVATSMLKARLRRFELKARRNNPTATERGRRKLPTTVAVLVERTPTGR